MGMDMCMGMWYKVCYLGIGYGYEIFLWVWDFRLGYGFGCEIWGLRRMVWVTDREV